MEILFISIDNILVKYIQKLSSKLGAEKICFGFEKNVKFILKISII